MFNINPFAELRVILNEATYLGLVLDATKYYCKENLGYVIGNVQKTRCRESYDLFTRLFISARSKRKFNSVQCEYQEIRKITGFLPNGCRTIGDGHSHTASYGSRVRLELSEGDIEDLEKKDWPFVSFLLTINPSKEKRRGIMCREREISWIKYIHPDKNSRKPRKVKMRLKVFYLTPDCEGKPREAEICLTRDLEQLINQNSMIKNGTS